MNKRIKAEYGLAKRILCLLALLPVAALAQVPVDENGEIIGNYEPRTGATDTGNEGIPLLSATDLEELVGPVALYPDDLLAVVLPASAYPLQIVEAARFLEELEDDPGLKPNADWDDSVVALVNYPEVVELLNEDIDWTWRLGEAVVSQQADVVAAIESFRDRAYAAGNLKSDSYQTVSRDEGVIEITPVSEEVIYVPYYEPERVVVYQPRPVYYYYPRPYPVYYYPYSSAHAFDHGFFWGVTTAFTIGWYSDSLHVFHHSYHGHPYYGYRYWDRWWYRRPTINVYNTTYVGRGNHVTINRYYGGDRWRPRHNRRDYVDETRVTRNRYYPSRSRDRDRDRVQRTTSVSRIDPNRQATRSSASRERSQHREPIRFRERPQTLAINRNAGEARQRNYSDDRTQRRERSGAVPRQRDHATRQRNADATPKLRRPEPTPKLQPRRVDPAPQLRRTEPATRVRRAEPETRVRRAGPSTSVRRVERPERAARAQVAPRPQPQRRESRSQRSTQRSEARPEPSRQSSSEKRASKHSESKSSRGSHRSRGQRR